MNLAISVYLDLFRLLAALVVFLSHTAGTHLTGFLVPEAGSFGGEAVAAFFVLSGFVIGYVADTRESSPRLYAISRLARVYSVALPAIAVTLAFDAVGRAFQPDIYAVTPIYWQPTSWLNLLSSVLFVNELWNSNIQLGTNGAYWSLGFEIWYYVLFGLVIFSSRRWRLIAIAAWLIFVGPRVALAFPIWLTGYGAYRLCKKPRNAPIIGAILFLMTILCYLPFHLTFGQHFALQFKMKLNDDMLRGYGYYYALGILISLNFIGFSLMSGMVSNLASRLAKPIRWLAGATFTFYLMHVPISVMLCAVSPWPANALSTRIVVLGGTIVMVLILAELGERRKTWWRRLFATLLPPQQTARTNHVSAAPVVRAEPAGGPAP